jgi:TolB protein
MVRWIAVLLLSASAAVHAELTIEITGGGENAIPIAVAPFKASGVTVPEDVAAIISADLYRSGRFRPTDPSAQPELPTGPTGVNFPLWRSAGIQNLVVGEVAPSGTGYALRFYLFDAFRGEQLTAETVTAAAKDLRFAAHSVADLIYERLTGQRGAFATRIAYVSSTRGADGKESVALNIADSDGHNTVGIARSAEPLMSPAWSPDASRLAYVSFEGGQPAIYVQEIATGKRERITAFPGINGAPAWSPDGTRLAVTLSKGRNPDIYVVDVASRAVRQLTTHRAIDTEPAWSPDGQHIVFTSDRGGRPQIYRMPAAGGPEQRITFEGTENTRASYSPDGKSLTMVTRLDGRFQIGLLDLETRGLQILSAGSLDESPGFAPNGAMIIYASSEGGRGVLNSVAVDGGVQTRLASQGEDVREPAWSPFLNRRF